MLYVLLTVSFLRELCVMNRVKKYITILLVTLLFFNAMTVFATPVVKTKKEHIESVATDSMTGTVLSQKTIWVNRTYSNLVYTLAEVEIESIKKTCTAHQQTITVLYEGGEINGETYVYERNPWGTVFLEIGRASCRERVCVGV